MIHLKFEALSSQSPGASIESTRALCGNGARRVLVLRASISASHISSVSDPSNAVGRSKAVSFMHSPAPLTFRASSASLPRDMHTIKKQPILETCGSVLHDSGAMNLRLGLRCFFVQIRAKVSSLNAANSGIILALCRRRSIDCACPRPYIFHVMLVFLGARR